MASKQTGYRSTGFNGTETDRKKFCPGANGRCPRPALSRALRTRPATAPSREAQLIFFVLRDPVDPILRLLGPAVGKLILHEEGVFAAVLVVAPEDAHGEKRLRSEEKLSSQVGFPHIERDARPPVTGEFANELGDHLAADAASAALRMDGKIQDMELR